MKAPPEGVFFYLSEVLSSGRPSYPRSNCTGTGVSAWNAKTPYSSASCISGNAIFPEVGNRIGLLLWLSA